MNGEDISLHEQFKAMGADLQKAASDVRDAFQGLDKDGLEDEMSRDLIGWGVAHAGSYALDMLVPGASAIPLKGLGFSASPQRRHGRAPKVWGTALQIHHHR